ncbi:recombination mediator RecR [Patescibacteria group bacterium]|nr:recombination mediator RecR [Patescibacteria group bacterium]
MNHIPQSITNLINQFAKLPGIGQKTASRLTYYLLRKSGQDVLDFGQAMTNLKKNLISCSRCHNYANQDPCSICQDPKRDPQTICVIEQPLDIIAVEKTGFKGHYHVLHGALAPIEGIGPEHLTLENLKNKVNNNDMFELIIATNPNLEGEATAIYIQNMLSDQNIKITRLAFGLPMGIDLEYTDEITLTKAFEGRK